MLITTVPLSTIFVVILLTVQVIQIESNTGRDRKTVYI